MSSTRIRYSLQFLQRLYDTDENPVPLEKLVLAFRHIQERSPDDPNSYFVIAGYHGLPFVGPGETAPESD